MASRHRVFLDANVLFSAAYRRDSGLRVLWRLTRTDLVSSRYAALEARRNLSEPDQRAELERSLATMRIVEAESRAPVLPAGISLPEKDLPILAAALASGADTLLTGDARHFGAYYGKLVGRVRILPPAEYLRLRRGE